MVLVQGCHVLNTEPTFLQTNLMRERTILLSRLIGAIQKIPNAKIEIFRHPPPLNPP